MISAINSALSGFTAATQRLNISAGNIANQFSTQTTNDSGKTLNSSYVPEQLTQASQTAGGVSTATQPVTPADQSIYNPSDPAANTQGVTQFPNVDTAQQLIQAQTASYDAQPVSIGAQYCELDFLESSASTCARI